MTASPSQLSAECHSLCAGRRGAPLLSPLDRPSASYRKACQRIPRLKLILVAPAAKQTADPTEGPGPQNAGRSPRSRAGGLCTKSDNWLRGYSAVTNLIFRCGSPVHRRALPFTCRISAKPRRPRTLEHYDALHRNLAQCGDDTILTLPS